jgi:Zn-dependent alcohol dehydrogenase
VTGQYSLEQINEALEDSRNHRSVTGVIVPSLT